MEEQILSVYPDLVQSQVSQKMFNFLILCMPYNDCEYMSFIVHENCVGWTYINHFINNLNNAKDNYFWHVLKDRS